MIIKQLMIVETNAGIEMENVACKLVRAMKWLSEYTMEQKKHV